MAEKALSAGVLLLQAAQPAVGDHFGPSAVQFNGIHSAEPHFSFNITPGGRGRGACAVAILPHCSSPGKRELCKYLKIIYAGPGILCNQSSGGAGDSGPAPGGYEVTEPITIVWWHALEDQYSADVERIVLL